MLTDEQDESSGQHAAEHGDEKLLGFDVLVIEIAESRHTKALEDVVDVKQTCQHLSEVAEDVIPTNRRRSRIRCKFCSVLLIQKNLSGKAEKADRG